MYCIKFLIGGLIYFVVLNGAFRSREKLVRWIEKIQKIGTTMSLIANYFCNQIVLVRIPTMGLMMFLIVLVGFYNDVVGDVTSDILMLPQ